MKSLKLIVCFGLALAMAKSYHSKAKYSKKDYDEHSFKMRQSSVDDIENIDYWYDMGSDELDAAMSATTGLTFLIMVIPCVKCIWLQYTTPGLPRMSSSLSVTA